MPPREWRVWMESLGRTVRHARELAGLTQLELATRAGVSQRAISRLEVASGLSTPLFTVMRILAALRETLGALPSEDVPGELRRLVDMAATSALDGEPASDGDLPRLLRIYGDLKPVERAPFVRIAVASADAIVSARKR